MHGPWSARPEDEPEDVAAHRPLHLERRLGLCRNRQVALAAEIERLQLDRDGFPVLVTEPQPQAAERVRRHRLSLACAIAICAARTARATLPRSCASP